MNEWKKLCKICFKVGLCWTWHSLIRCLLPTHWGFFFILKTSQDLWLNWVRWRACQNTTDCRALKAVYVKSKWHIFIAFGSFAPYPYQGSASWTQLGDFRSQIPVSAPPKLKLPPHVIDSLCTARRVVRSWRCYSRTVERRRESRERKREITVQSEESKKLSGFVAERRKRFATRCSVCIYLFILNLTLLLSC